MTFWTSYRLQRFPQHLLRGRPRKQDTPLVKSQVRMSTRNNKEGYKKLALQNRATVRRKASKAMAPKVLQVSEMQRMGIEKCQIDPDELSEERLLQGRKE